MNRFGLLLMVVLLFAAACTTGVPAPQWRVLKTGSITRSPAYLPQDGVHLLQDLAGLQRWTDRYQMDLPTDGVDFSKHTVAVLIRRWSEFELVIKEIRVPEGQPSKAVIAFGEDRSKSLPQPAMPAGLEVRQYIAVHLMKVSQVEVGPAGEAASTSTPAPDPYIASAAALGLGPAEILNWAPYDGGQVGATTFRPGRVLLWAPEPGQLTVSSVISEASGAWTGGGNLTTTVLSKDERFAPSTAIINPVTSVDRKVPLIAIFGQIHHPATARIQVRLSGDGWHDARLSNGTFLFVWQGVLFGSDFEVVALDAGGGVLETMRVRSPIR